MTKKKYNPQLYMAARRNNVERKKQALKEAREVARFLIETCGAKVHGIGSLFEKERPFSSTSDIDLVVEGIPKNKFFTICEEAAELSQFNIDIIPYEDSNELVRETVRERGVLL